jgi:kynurenine formamidase
MNPHPDSASPRWRKRPDGSNWGDWGADDSLGRLNLLTPQKVREGVAEVKEGISFCLSLPLDYPGGNVLNPRRHPPQIHPTVRNGRPNLNYVMAQDKPLSTDVMSDDAVVLHTQYSTQWDGLAHVGGLFDADGAGHATPMYYNGFRAGTDVFAGGYVVDDGGRRVSALGIERMAQTGVQGRGVMIDLRHHLGDSRTNVGYEDLTRIMEADHVMVEPGDMVCLHTGFADVVLRMAGQPDPHTLEHSCAVLDGRDERLLRWIDESGLAAIACDNYAVESHPASHRDGNCSDVPLHEWCIFKLGIHLGELWWLTPLAGWLRAHARNRFLLTAPPLALPGAIGSPVTPVATV